MLSWYPRDGKAIAVKIRSPLACRGVYLSDESSHAHIQCLLPAHGAVAQSVHVRAYTRRGPVVVFYGLHRRCAGS